jgi:uncharacterized membrane protein (DUF4010 family)
MSLTLNPDLVHFVVTAAFSFLVGLEIKTYRQQYHTKSDGPFFFGTTRTFTFIGILGFLFYRIDPQRLVPYTTVLILLSLLYMLFYRQRLAEGRPSILLYVVLLCVYAFGPLSALTPLWIPALLFVVIVFLLNAKSAINRFIEGTDTYEFETLGKMVLLSAVILPLLPDQRVFAWLPLSPFKIWLAVVVISAISYGGYLAQKYFFPNKGYFLTGIIGGTYSSTATTVVLARKVREIGRDGVIDAAIISATSMMYLRLIVVAMVFNFAIGKELLLPFVVLALAGFAVSGALMRHGAGETEKSEFVDSNPLELGTAFVFAFLFVLMMLLTQYVTHHYGDSGLQILSFLIGFTDIDPFVLSLLTGKYAVSGTEILTAIMIAAGSNNLLKAGYALWFGGWRQTWRSALAITVLGCLTIGWALWLSHGGGVPF